MMEYTLAVMKQEKPFKPSRMRIAGLLVIAVSILAAYAEPDSISPSLPRLPGIAVQSIAIQSDARKKLMKEYSRVHYGSAEWQLVNPRMIVVHFTGTDSDEESLSAFIPERLSSARQDITSGGEVNVGVHYMITRDGTVWALLPETAMGRHAIGFNYIALGIEMTGSSGEKLTAAQLTSCAALVANIARRIPSIQYLCGHHEYTQKERAHFYLYKELAQSYKPTVKIDPGEKFMTLLRDRLKLVYGLQLED